MKSDPQHIPPQEEIEAGLREYNDRSMSQATSPRPQRCESASVASVAGYWADTTVMVGGKNVWLQVHARELADGSGVSSRRLGSAAGHTRRIRQATPATDSQRASTGAIAFVQAQRNRKSFLMWPQKDDRNFGAAAYPFEPSPNPTMWLPIIEEFSSMDGVIWEYGPALVPSAKFIADHLQRDSVLLQPGSTTQPPKIRCRDGLPYIGNLPTADEQSAGRGRMTILKARHSKRKVQKHDGSSLVFSLDDLQPELALVPLPALCDMASFKACLTALTRQFMSPAYHGGGADWLWPFDANDCAQLMWEHPEFAMTVEQYANGLEVRLSHLRQLVRNGTSVCLAAPNIKGLPTVVEKFIQHHLTDWKLLTTRSAYETGVMRLPSNGSAYAGLVLTVWGRKP